MLRTTHRRPRLAAAAVVQVGVALAGVAGCAPAPVSLDVNFPSEESFLVSRFVAIDVVTGDVADPCGAALRQLESGTRPDGLVAHVDARPPCEVRRGVRLPDVGPGRRAYVATALDDTNTVLLSGCAVAEAHAGGPPIRIVLFATPNYAAGAARNPPLPGETVMSRCGAP